MTTEQMTGSEEQSRRLDTFFWAGALIWAGVVFGAEALGYLPAIGAATAWSWVFLGAGVLGLVLNIISMTSADYSNPTVWDWVWSLVFLLVGAAGFMSFNIPWWLILIVIGVAILVSAFRRRE